jgi:hypothetical protein
VSQRICIARSLPAAMLLVLLPAEKIAGKEKEILRERT